MSALLPKIMVLAKDTKAGEREAVRLRAEGRRAFTASADFFNPKRDYAKEEIVLLDDERHAEALKAMGAVIINDPHGKKAEARNKLTLGLKSEPAKTEE